jgi:uncharacterized membrane-anchored protein YitT (DUF2179 family)
MLQGRFFQGFTKFFLPDNRRSIESVRRRQQAKRKRREFIKHLRDVFLILLGVLAAGFGLKGFLITNGFIDGGVMGISLLTNSQTPAPLSLLIILFNLPFLLLGYRQISKIFSLKSILAITALALAVAFIP